MAKQVKKVKIGKKTTVFDFLIGQKVSLLIDHFKPNSRIKESYIGVVNDITDDGFVILDTEGNNRLTHILVRKDQIISIWVYKV